MIANAKGVAQAQLVQEKLDEVIFRIVRDETFDDRSVQFLDKEIKKFFGEKMNYRLEYVDHIALEASGKYRFSISKVDPGELF